MKEKCRNMRKNIKKTLPVLALGGVAGFLNGLLGAGGGILVVTGLGHLCPDAPDPRSCYASAVAVMLPLSTLSLLRYARAGHLPPFPLLSLLLPAALGGALGALLLRRLSPHALARLFSVLVLTSGVLLVIR
jgi:uncharacterized membrane protein YfcA